MKALLAAVAITATLTGCANLKTPLDDGYEFGDLTDTAIMLRAEYCASADPERRALRLAFLRATGVPVPPSGACGDIIKQAIARGLLPSGVALEMDIEQAREDRERFHED